MNASDLEWDSIKVYFNQWFEEMNFQNQAEAKRVLLNIRFYFRSFRLVAMLRELPKLFILDPWFWRYRGINFVYPQDVECFLKDFPLVSG